MAQFFDVVKCVNQAALHEDASRGHSTVTGARRQRLLAAEQIREAGRLCVEIAAKLDKGPLGMKDHYPPEQRTDALKDELARHGLRLEAGTPVEDD